jgi:hypothetical protein
MKFMLSDNCPTVVPNGTRDESDLLRFAGLIKKFEIVILSCITGKLLFKRDRNLKVISALCISFLPTIKPFKTK